MLFRALTCYNVCVVSCPDVLQWLCSAVRVTVFVLLCPDVLQCVVSCLGVFKCLYCVVRWRVTMFVLCSALACSKVCVVSCLDVLQCLCRVVPWSVLMLSDHAASERYSFFFPMGVEPCKSAIRRKETSFAPVRCRFFRYSSTESSVGIRSA